MLAALLCACRSDPGPPPPAPAPTPAPAPVVLGPASRRALVELAAPVIVTADLAGLAEDDAGRTAALLDAFASGGRLSWRRGALGGPALSLRAKRPGDRGDPSEHDAPNVHEERLALPAGEGRLDAGELEAGIVTRLLRLAHGRKKIGITSGHGEDGWEGLADAELGLGASYDPVRVDWSAPRSFDTVDALVIDGPRGPLPRPGLVAVEALRASGRPILYLVDDAVDPRLLEPVGFRVVPGTLVDPVNGTPFQRDGGIALSAAPLAQVLAGAPGDPLARLHYVSVPLAVALLAPDGARPLLRTSPQTRGGARIVGYALESPTGARLAVVGSAALVGADRRDLHRRLGAEVTAGGFRAVSRLVDWLVADVEIR